MTKEPRRMSKLLSEMLTHCSQDIQAYGSCVTKVDGLLNRNACQQEFAKVRSCFQKASKCIKKVSR
uniref:AlNc14C140G7233 protein n=1 Tax=Albugo laibachii Nc14 TaxID=890382 RepID=F0WL46_9STRA|nr:AlNc14C140G7233 [Albugo laibachii Nc14]|eukprot:CCA22006.1 AlNc14C140G7233 [Albugo laibachii Nc14]